MKKRFCIITALAISICLAATASADLQTDLKIFRQDDGTSIVGVLDGKDLSGWCAVYLSGEHEGCAFWGFFQDGKASGILCLKDGTSIPATYENGKMTTEQEVSRESNAAPQKDETRVTIGMQNALKSANQYLSITGFSYSGLVKQLEFEQYTHEEAVYAADHCGADWNEQAVRSAKQYLSIMSFSRNGLIKQLEYDGYTNSQAVYAVTQCGY